MSDHNGSDPEERPDAADSASPSSGEEDADDWDDELGDIDDLSDPESDLEDSLPVATAEAVPGKQEYLDSCARKHIIPVSAFIKSMGQNKVSLRHYLLGAQGATAVADALKINTTIQSLDLSGTWLGVEGAQALQEALQDNVTMEYLDVSDNRLGLHGGLAMSALLRENDTLADVCLSGNKLCDHVANHLADSLRKNTTLTRLDLSHNEIRDRGGERMAKVLLENQQIRDLDLSWNQLTTRAGLAFSNSIAYNKSLTVLDIGWNGIGDEAGKTLDEALAENDVLRHLNLANNRLSSVSAEAIAKGVEANKGLVSLLLDSNPFGAKGCDRIMEALKLNSAIINVGLNNVEPEANFATKEEPPPGAPPIPTAEDGTPLAPPTSPRTLLTPRQVWARNPEHMTLPCASKPTGYFKINLSKPWERLAAERLAKVVPQDGIVPLATIRPNLAHGKDAEIFDLAKNASSMPDSGLLQVKFQCMEHPDRQTIVYKLDLADPKQVQIAQTLREKVCELMHDEFGDVKLGDRPYTVPLNEDPKWKWPSTGIITASFITPSLVYHMPFKLVLSDILDQAVAEFLQKQVLQDPTQQWVAPQHEGEEYDFEANEKLPTFGELTFKHEVSQISHQSTEHFKLNLAKEDQRETADGLNKRQLKFPGINVADAKLDNQPYTIQLNADGVWQLPKKGSLEFDLVTLAHEVGAAASHSDVLRVEEALHDLKTDEERMEELTQGAGRDMWLLAEQAKKLIECFRDSDMRVNVLKIILPKIIAINNFELMRGCV